MDQARQTQVAEYIARSVGASTDLTIHNIRQLSGGDSRENWLFELELVGGELTGRQLFVVRMEDESLMPFSHNCLQEFHLQKFLKAHDVMVPEPMFLSEDEEISPQPFYVMPRVAGRGSGERLISDIGGTEEGVEFVEIVAVELAKLHAIRPPQEELIFLGSPPERPARKALDQAYAYLDNICEKSSALAYPVLEWGLRWLSNNEPERQDVALCHGDFHLGNLMISDKKLSGILDWEYTDWFDPHLDLATFCAKFARFSAPERLAGGLANQEQFITAYAKASKREIGPRRIRWWQILANIRRALVCIEYGHRYQDGLYTSLDLALRTHAVASLEFEILSLIDRSERQPLEDGKAASQAEAEASKVAIKAKKPEKKEKKEKNGKQEKKAS